jgi:hypothetical protein
MSRVSSKELRETGSSDLINVSLYERGRRLIAALLHKDSGSAEPAVVRGLAILASNQDFEGLLQAMTEMELGKWTASFRMRVFHLELFSVTTQRD